MKIWIARDKFYGWVFLANKKPIKNEHGNHSLAEGNKLYYVIEERGAFPEVTWENSPKRIKLELL